MTRKGDDWVAAAMRLQPPAKRPTMSSAAARRRMMVSIAVLRASDERGTAEALRGLRVGLIKRRAQAVRQLHGIVIRPEVHVEKAWLVVQRVVVNGRDFDAALAKRSRNRVDLAAEHGEVAGDSCLTADGRLEVEDGHDAHRREQVDPHLGDLLGARDVDLIDPTALNTAGAAEDAVNLAGVEVDAVRWRSGRTAVERRATR